MARLKRHGPTGWTVSKLAWERLEDGEEHLRIVAVFGPFPTHDAAWADAQRRTREAMVVHDNKGRLFAQFEVSWITVAA